MLFRSLGALAAALFLYGFAFIYGSTGTIVLTEIQQAYAREGVGTFGIVGMMLALLGIGFKIAAVPFHYWTPDAYQGSPTPITGYLSVGPKVGAFALMIKLFLFALLPLASTWVPKAWIGSRPAR